MTTETLDVNKLRNFKRTARLTVYRTTTPIDDTSFAVSNEATGANGMIITELRMQFTIERDLSKHPNSASVKITNLNEASRAALNKKPLHVIMEAGYDGLVQQIFEGDIVFGMSTLEHPNWTTLLQLGDGARVSAGARISRSYTQGTTFKSAIRDICKSFGQNLPKNLENDKGLDAQFESGAALFGASKDELTRLLTPHGYSWSFQDSRLQIIKTVDDTTRLFEYAPISADTGMIGTPDFGTPTQNGKPPHVTIKTLLRPDLRPGKYINVVSRNLNGSFKMIKVTHAGDTHGTEWETTVEVKPA